MTRIKKVQIWVIIPGYNESKNISKVLNKVCKHTQNVIYVDDGSKDSSAQIALEHTPHVLSHKVNLGKGAALKTGCEYAFNKMDAGAVVFLDADNQHDPQELILFFNELKRGYGAVFGVRKLDKKMPKKRIMANLLLSKIIQLFFQTYVPDIISGYKTITKNTYSKIKWNTPRYSVETEVVVRILKNKIKFKKIKIKTIYNDKNNGMSMLDIPGIISNIFLLKLRT